MITESKICHKNFFFLKKFFFGNRKGFFLFIFLQKIIFWSKFFFCHEIVKKDYLSEFFFQKSFFNEKLGFMFSIKAEYYSGQIMRVEKFLLVGALGRKCAVDNHR